MEVGSWMRSCHCCNDSCSVVSGIKTSLSLETSRLIASNKIKVCLLFSQQNAQHFVNLIKKANLKKQSKNIKFLTLSSNITKILKKNGYTRVSSSNFPTLASMLDKLLKMRML